MVVRRAAWISPLLFALCAQAAPQLLWQGTVDGIVILHLHGRMLAVQVQEGGPVTGAKYHFFDPLPETQQNIRVEVLEGRGYVHVIDQPNLDNQYTASVAIEDRQPGSAFYSIALHWDTSNVPFETRRKTDRVTWTGRVDGDAVVSCQRQHCTSDSQRGAPVFGDHYKFSHPLPTREVNVRLEYPEGRGEIHLIEQPSQANQYTARVAIRDPQSGSSDYSFTLVWNRDGGKNEASTLPDATGRAFLWSGKVDGRARVTIESGASFSEALSGGRVTGEHSDLLRPLPKRTDLQPRIDKLHGRGKVSIVEMPSAKNNYSLVFEVDDPGPGPENYEVQLDW